MGSCSGKSKNSTLSQTPRRMHKFPSSVPRINSPSSTSVYIRKNPKEVTTSHRERVMELLQPANRRVYNERSFYDECSIMTDQQQNIQSGMYKVQHNITGQIRFAKLKQISNKKVHKQNDYYQYKLIDHPNFFKLFEFYQTESQMITIFEFCQSVTLKQLMNEGYEFSKDELIRLTYQMVSAISYLNHKILQHFRISPEHIMFVESCQLFIEQSFLIKLISPEILHQKTEIDPYYQLPSKEQNYDIWSIGIILYEICVGKHPFIQSDIPIAYRMSQGLNSYNYDELNGINPQLKDLIIKMLQYQKRYSAKQLMKEDYIQSFHYININFKKNFKKQINTLQSTFHLIIHSTMVHQFVSQMQRENLAISFLVIDKQAKGYLNKHDLLAIHIDETEIDTLMLHFQENKLYFKDFILIAADYKSILSEYNIHQLFSQMIQYQKRTSVNLTQIIGNTLFITPLIEEDLDIFSKQLKLRPYQRISRDLFTDLVKKCYVKTNPNQHE